MWRGIHGHDQIVRQFASSLTQGRLASSYLFVGPAGVGKQTFALKLAEVLLCVRANQAQLEPCGQCPSCQMFAAGNHPDLDTVRPPPGKRNLPVELFIGDREHRNQTGLCHNLAFRPQLGRRRVAIIDEADLLSTESANCLLKTLEEPPPGAVLILIGTSRSRQLPTILSRTQVVRFGPLDPKSICTLLLEHEYAADEAQARLLAEACQGSLQQAATLADPEVFTLYDQLLPRLATERLDSVGLSAELIKFVNAAGKEAEARRQRLRILFQLVGSLFRHVLRSACDAEPGQGNQLAAAAAGLLQYGSQAQSVALDVLERCLEAESELDRNANQATLLECWLDDLASILSRLEPAAARAN